MAESKQHWDRFLLHSSDKPVRSEFTAAFADQAVCVTGAGGYIGSALVRALAAEPLRSLVLLDSSEQGLFEIQRHMEAEHAQTKCEYVLGRIDDAELVAAVFTRLRPQIVFHAAAFKHVGLLEQNPFAAIRNNALGTHTLLQAALQSEVATFILVSTDKAVHPHSMMGVSKRLAELITLSHSRPAFHSSAVRLANVIGSSGSVVPIFLDQMAKGQPLSVTHAHASRYFLSRDEAVSAILAAGAAACDGKILLPDFGEPVRVADFAAFLSGNIRFTGLRPGEKLTEDLIGAKETRIGTVPGPLTVIETDTLSKRECEKAVAALSACVAHRDLNLLLETLRELIPEYVPSKLMQKQP